MGRLLNETRRLRPFVHERKGIEMGYPLSNSKTTPTEAAHPKRLKTSEVAKGAILAEQLSYLFGHVGSCPDDCPDCTRLRSVERILLQPFTVGGLGAPGATLDVGTSTCCPSRTAGSRSRW